MRSSLLAAVLVLIPRSSSLEPCVANSFCKVRSAFLESRVWNCERAHLQPGAIPNCNVEVIRGRWKSKAIRNTLPTPRHFVLD